MFRKFPYSSPEIELFRGSFDYFSPSCSGQEREPEEVGVNAFKLVAGDPKQTDLFQAHEAVPDPISAQRDDFVAQPF